MDRNIVNDDSTISKLHGHYLITNRNHVFSDDKEIFVLLYLNDVLYGICINKYCKDETGNNLSLFDFRDVLKKSGIIIGDTEILKNTPVLKGGIKIRSSLFSLYALPFDERVTETPYECMYQILPISDFIKYILSVPNLWFFQIVSGMEIFTVEEIASRVFMNDWELRQGLHALTYGRSLDEKINWIDALSTKKHTNYLSGDLDIGSLLHSFIDLSHEAAPSIARTAVIGYLKATHPELDKSTVDKIVRMMLAVEDAKLGDIQDIMKKYTHEELFKLYEELEINGQVLEFLDKYDQRIAMHNDIGLESHPYDIYVALMITETRLTDRAAKPEKTGKPGSVEGRIDMMAKIVTGQSAVSDEKQ